MPGLAYQLGILLASPTNSIQYALHVRFGYQWAIAGFEVVTILTLAMLLWLGSEEHGRSFVRSAKSDVGEPAACTIRIWQDGVHGFDSSARLFPRWLDARRWPVIIFMHSAPVAQLDRASGYEPESREFESPRSHHLKSYPCFHLRGFILFNRPTILYP